MNWWLARDTRPDALGFLPSFLDDADPRPAQQQLDANYPHGGYWRSEGASIDDRYRLCYPGDPPLPWIAVAILRDEMILLYPADFVAIMQPDRTFKFQRMD